jgi:hypothetical protein
MKPDETALNRSRFGLGKFTMNSHLYVDPEQNQTLSTCTTNFSFNLVMITDSQLLTANLFMPINFFFKAKCTHHHSVLKLIQDSI